jgi:hypothetical protein
MGMVIDNALGYFGISKSNMMAEALKMVLPKSVEHLVDLGFAANEFMKGMKNGDMSSRIGTIANHLKDSGIFSAQSPLSGLMGGLGGAGGLAAAGGLGALMLGKGFGGLGAPGGAGLAALLGGGGAAMMGGTLLSGLMGQQMGPLGLIQSLTGSNPLNPVINGAAAALTGNVFGTQQIKTNLGLNGTRDPNSMMARLPKNASFEDLVAAMMFDTVKEEQNKVKAKLAELKDQAAAADTSKKGGGLFGGLGGFIGAALPIAGAIFGGPVGGMIGQAVGGMAGNAVNGANQGEKGAESRNLAFEELKIMMQRLSEMQQAMSNVLNAIHQTAESAIKNIR